MSAAIAMATTPAGIDRPPFSADIAPSNSPSAHRTAAATQPPASAPSNVPAQSPSPKSGIAKGDRFSSPNSARHVAPAVPRIFVKKEREEEQDETQSQTQAQSQSQIQTHAPNRQAPTPLSSRRRPKNLDLSNTPQTQGQMTGGLGSMQEVGLAYLSPNLLTHDPIMKEQLQRSMDVREQQRRIIEQRQQQSARGPGAETSKEKEFKAQTPGFSSARKRVVPPGLSIVAPSHEQFASERVIQSAPLGHSFTGRNNPYPLARQIANQPSNLSNTSHIHHVPANQTRNRLPPITDVFGQCLPARPETSRLAPAHMAPGSLISPGLPSHHQQQQQQAQAQAQTPGRLREYKSAEEAQAELAGGRPELLPNASRRRTRAEYEDGASPPLGTGRPAMRRGPFGEGKTSPETQHAKRARFLRICEEAWDLFHS